MGKPSRDSRLWTQRDVKIHRDIQVAGRRRAASSKNVDKCVAIILAAPIHKLDSAGTS